MCPRSDYATDEQARLIEQHKDIKKAVIAVLSLLGGKIVYAGKPQEKSQEFRTNAGDQALQGSSRRWDATKQQVQRDDRTKKAHPEQLKLL